MTIAEHVARTQSVASGGQTVFTYGFQIDDETYIKVYQRAAAATPNDTTDLLTLTTEYTVTGVGAAGGGTIVLVTGATAGDIITCEGMPPESRDTSFTPAGLIKAENLNTEFDNLILLFQRVTTELEQRGLLYPASATIASKDRILPILGAEQTWVKNAGNTALVAADFPADGAASKIDTFVTTTDETADAPNSFPLSSIGSGLMINKVSDNTILVRTLTGTANQIDVSNGTGLSGNPTLSITSNPLIPGTAGMGVPQGTTAQRVVPASGVAFRFNTDLVQLEYYDGSSWIQVEDSGDFATIYADFASHVAAKGASLVGLQDQGSVSSKTVQDLANATLIAQTDNGTLANGQFLAALSTGILKSTTTTGVLSISTPLTSIDGLTTAADKMIYTTASNTYAVTDLTSFARLVNALTASNSATLITSGGGVPSLSQTLPTAVQDNITQLGAQAEALNMNSHLINNVTDPTSAQDAATKAYVDAVATGLNIQAACVCASTTALTVTYANGTAGVGATLTNAGALAAISLDGVSPTSGQRVLIKNQASSFQNGIYTVTTAGSGAVAWVLTRATDFDTPAEIQPGDLCPILTGGTTLGGSSWMQTATVTSVGVDAVTFIQFSASIPVNVASGGTGLTTLTAHNVLLGEGTSNVAFAAPSATAGVPLVSAGAASDPAFGTAVVAGGGTGLTSATAYAVLTGGTTSTGAFQSIASVGTSGQVLTSNGAAALPSFQAIPAASTATNLSNTGTAVTVTDSTGRMTLPAQPYFDTQLGSAVTNVTGDGTNYTVLFTTINYNIGTSYASGTGIFTAPIAGKYLFNFTVAVTSVGAGHTSGDGVRLVTSTSGTFYSLICNYATIPAAGSIYMSGSAIATMTAGSTAKIQVQLTGSTKTVGVGDTAGTRFSGWLVG